MKVLIVGGTGMIGGTAALHLRGLGHAVTLAARKPPTEGPLTGFPVLIGDYMGAGFALEVLAGFDAIVFAAGNDIRHQPIEAQTDDFWRAAQSEGVPAFAKRARTAGIARFVQIGSYYHQLRPDLAETNVYVRARRDADEGTRALATAGFAAMTLNPPSVVGALRGIPAKRYRTLAEWGRGLRPDLPIIAPPGGTVYMSVRSLAQAIAGALARGEGGRAYLVGDESLSYRDFFQLFFDVQNNPAQVRTVDAENALLPDAFIVQGRGAVLAYEPDAAETALLGYDRHDIRRAVAEVVAQAGEVV